MKNKANIVVLLAILTIAGCTTTKLIENPPGSGNYQKQVQVDPKLASALDAAKAVNDASGLFNPWSGAITLVLGAISGIATWRAKQKNDQLSATIAGVEAKGGAEVKDAIKAAAMAAGVEASLNKSVKAVTG